MILFRALAAVLAAAASAQAAASLVEETDYASLDSSSRELMIAGGLRAGKKDFPYFVQIGKCGGVLITPEVVLSSVFCIDRFELYDLVRVQVGAWKTNSTNQGVPRTCVEVVRHPDFLNAINPTTIAMNDFALCRLHAPVLMDLNGKYTDSYDGYPISVELNADPDVPKGQNEMLIMAGMGTISADNDLNGEYSKYLKKIEVPTIKTHVCNREDWYDGYVSKDTSFCAGFTEGGDSPCWGDAGGPIVKRPDGETSAARDVLVGTFSWMGTGCGDYKQPGVYSRASVGRPWIEQMVCDVWGMADTATYWDSVDGPSNFCPTATPSPSPYGTTGPTSHPSQQENPLAPIRPSCEDGEEAVQIAFKADSLKVESYEETWQLMEAKSGKVVAEITDGYARNSVNMAPSEDTYYCLESRGKYALKITDWYGDGLTAGKTGYAKVLNNGCVVGEDDGTDPWYVKKIRFRAKAKSDIRKCITMTDQDCMDQYVRIGKTPDGCKDYVAIGNTADKCKKKKYGTKVFNVCPTTCGAVGLGRCANQKLIV